MFGVSTDTAFAVLSAESILPTVKVTQTMQQLWLSVLADESHSDGCRRLEGSTQKDLTHGNGN